MVEAGFEEELNPACRAGRCTDPIEAGGLGVVELHPLNAEVLVVYERYRRLTPTIALLLTDLSWHPDPELLAEQLEVLTLAFGPMGDPPPRCPAESSPQRACGQMLVIDEGRWRCRACGWPER